MGLIQRYDLIEIAFKDKPCSNIYDSVVPIIGQWFFSEAKPEGQQGVSCFGLAAVCGSFDARPSICRPMTFALVFSPVRNLSDVYLPSTPS
jgi:hypothetical protein